MKIEFIIFCVTIFFIANTYHDGKYVTLVKSWKKYYQMAAIGFTGISTYAFLKKYPSNTKGFIENANGIIKHMPIDKESADLLSPLLDMTQSSNFGLYNMSARQANLNPLQLPTKGQKRMLNSGKNATKRSVSETKKKYIAAQQGWKCGDCKKQLPAWFEVDHKVRLDSGGSNHIDNLIALCRDCHGKKTAMENL